MNDQLKGRTILVTGATGGIGLEACVQLASMGATLVMVGRDAGRTDRALEEVKRRSGSNDVSTLLCDFSSQAQVRALADAFRARHSRLDVLVNNAGSVNATRTLTVDGLETTFAVNHLGYHLLTNLLLDLLEKSAPARIVNVASEAHRQGVIDFDNLQFEKGGYGTLKAYANSKLANILFTRELSRRLAGKNVTVNCLHPGVVDTGIWDKSPWYYKPLILPAKLFFISAEKGGRTITHLAASDEVAKISGEYFTRNRVTKSSRLARDESLARRLWDESDQLVKRAR